MATPYYGGTRGNDRTANAQRMWNAHLRWALLFYHNSYFMHSNKNQQVVNLQVTDGLSVAVLQDQAHEFLMPVKDVALGYGVSSGTIRSTQSRHQDELIEGKHYIRGVAFCNTLANVQPHAVYWTKTGIVRLGFFIKSERAKMFRDWAENVILKTITPQLPVNLPKPKRRKHNRLTQERMIGILADVAKIEDRALRLSLIEKLGV
ncbi:hypothetical protein [Riemerella anatipestifer]|uniref:hypothetical protein n=1 Tax=Riemerella anatipestifer TaxID=34085 RepID=UPI0021F872C0|nr:hypothetical protein [Riemerella anatipestifer]MCW0509496.1 hypothetical protein [Riemerella anatipestifer]MDY3337808.1 hypothetical protein [Riemerella anatipestifer]MDY3522047.1 hypothetical protein [Riemerella anatipestifer]MDY3534314.1 hypothetical protein [Riemerella anatipestifer]MDY3536361.1 hypothetical protein [Riemerella anatipestifer]